MTALTSSFPVTPEQQGGSDHGRSPHSTGLLRPANGRAPRQSDRNFLRRSTRRLIGGRSGRDGFSLTTRSPVDVRQGPIQVR